MDDSMGNVPGTTGYPAMAEGGKRASVGRSSASRPKRCKVASIPRVALMSLFTARAAKYALSIVAFVAPMKLQRETSRS